MNIFAARQTKYVSHYLCLMLRLYSFCSHINKHNSVRNIKMAFKLRFKVKEKFYNPKCLCTIINSSHICNIGVTVYKS